MIFEKKEKKVNFHLMVTRQEWYETSKKIVEKSSTFPKFAHIGH